MLDAKLVDAEFDLIVARRFFGIIKLFVKKLVELDFYFFLVLVCKLNSTK